MTNTSFKLPLELKHLSDEEFWDRLDEMDALSEDIDQHFGGLALTMYMEHKEVNIPFVRFKKNLPSIAS